MRKLLLLLMPLGLFGQANVSGTLGYYQSLTTNGTAGNITISEGNTLTLNVDDADADPTNEIQTLSLAGNNLSLTSGGTVDLSGFVSPPNLDNDATNEIQSLSLSGNNLTLSNGGGTVTITHPANLDNDPTNEIQTLTVTRLPLYEYRDQWAEEGGGAIDNSAQYSYGNGATGFKGLPYDDGWEIIAVYIHSDNNGPNDDMSVFIQDFQNVAANGAPVIATITYVNSGDGSTNNGYQYTPLTATIPDGAVLGFRTDNENGNVSDIVVGFRSRRQIGEYVSDVTISN